MVDGRALLSLSREKVLQLTGMKVGPSVKICDLISQLKTTKGNANGSVAATAASRPPVQSPPPLR